MKTKRITKTLALSLVMLMLYDVTGTKNGGKTLTLDYATTEFYFSPVTITE